MLFRLSVITLTASLVACTQVPVLSLPVSSANQCSESEGVSLRYNTLTIALGARPSAGYSVELLSKTNKEQRYFLRYQERTPDPSMRHVQIMTSPCTMIVLPQGWQSIEVTNAQTDEVTRFTAQTAQ